MPLKFGENNEVIRREHYDAILVGIQTGPDVEESMEELAGLAEAAEVSVLGKMVQLREAPSSATYLGKGKTEELGELCAAMGADTVIVNDELTGVQYRNLEETLGVKVIDRTMLILDIFAARAATREGKLQVEMAQLQYRLPRMRGYGTALSRLGGGIGTRGPGEKKLETDRRHIRSRMDEIRRELKEVSANRRTQRSAREKRGVPVVALVGYTNAGKSAVMNRLLRETCHEDKEVKEQDMLFATLDTFQRRMRLDTGQEFVLVDTVGFVSKLPHTLVDAFKATLEEVVTADLLLHVVDAASPNHAFRAEVTEQVLAELGAGQKDRLTLYNKSDLLPESARPPVSRELPGRRSALWISARTGLGMEALAEEIKSRLFANRLPVKLALPFSRGDIQSYLCEKYPGTETEYTGEGMALSLALDPEDLGRLRPFLIEGPPLPPEEE